MLLLAVLLLTAQSLAFWHSHDNVDSPDSSCQLCLHAQNHTPATVSTFTPALSVFTHYVVTHIADDDIDTTAYQIFSNPRAPPALFLT